VRKNQWFFFKLLYCLLYKINFLRSDPLSQNVQVLLLFFIIDVLIHFLVANPQEFISSFKENLVKQWFSLKQVMVLHVVKLPQSESDILNRLNLKCLFIFQNSWLDEFLNSNAISDIAEYFGTQLLFWNMLIDNSLGLSIQK
jgi:hypothetical protein